MEIVRWLWSFIFVLQLGMVVMNSVEEEKRSLVIVFDTTASMGPHLEQLKKAAISIVKEFSATGKNTIYNYVLSQFNDPTVGPRTITTNADKFISDISKIKISGGGDCPELALGGMIAALSGDVVRMPIVFVITDAPEKDGYRFNELSKLIQSTQAQINFIRTQSCGSMADVMYNKIADFSGGLIFDIRVQDINDVLQALKRTLEKGRINIYHINYNHGGTHEIPISVDDTLNKLFVTLAGKDPKIYIRDPNNNVVKDVIKILDMHNIQSIEINDPIAGNYTLVSSSSSKHNIKVEGQSTLAMTYGFSLSQPDSATNSSFVPVHDEPNVLSVAVTSGADLIKSLTKVVLKSANKEITVALNYKSSGDLYTTNLFVPPNEAFKIIVFGLDKSGNIFQRILSTTMVPTRNFAPILMKKGKTDKIFVGDSYSVVCDVTSFASATIQWKKGDRVIKSTTLPSGEKNHKFVHNFDSIQLSDAGEYMCTATNEYGTKYLRTTIVVNEIPELTVSPKSITTTEGANVQIKCNVKNIDSTAIVYWKFNNQRVPNTRISADHTLTLSNINRKESGSYVCALDYDRFQKTDSAAVTVAGEKPKLLVPASTTLYVDPGKELDLPCICRGCQPIKSYKWRNPRGFIFAGDANERKHNVQSSRLDLYSKAEANNFNFNLKLLKAYSRTEGGKYTCEVENDFGKDSLTLTVVVNGTR